MILELLLLLTQNPQAPGPEARVDFYSISNASADVELAVEAEAAPASAAGAKPARVSRMFTWHAGGSDNSELARIVAEALAKGGLDASYEGAEVIVKNAVSLQVHTKDWTALGAQVWALVPKGVKSPRLAVTFEAKGPVGKAACAVSSSSKTAAPKAIEGDDLTNAKYPADPKAGDPKKDPKSPPVKPKDTAKPADPKAKNVKSIEVKPGFHEGTPAVNVLTSVLTLARAAEWKVEADGARVLRIDAAADGAPPKWAAIRFVGKGDATIGVKILPPDENAPADPRAKK